MKSLNGSAIFMSRFQGAEVQDDAVGKVGQQRTHDVACRIGQLGICLEVTKLSQSVQPGGERDEMEMKRGSHLRPLWLTIMMLAKLAQ
jgi:hypothetical protein